MCVVGEWDGDTAEPSFTAQLLAGFRLVDRCALPNWSDTAHELTVWERRGDSENLLPQVRSPKLVNLHRMMQRTVWNEHLQTIR